MSSPDPLASLVENCRVAMQAIEDAQSIIETCIARLEATSAADRARMHPGAGADGSHVMSEKQPRAGAP